MGIVVHQEIELQQGSVLEITNGPAHFVGLIVKVDQITSDNQIICTNRHVRRADFPPEVQEIIIHLDDVSISYLGHSQLI